MRSLLDAPDRLVPAVVVPYAIWTMYVHLITATHSSFVALLHGLPLVALVALVATSGWFRLPEPAIRRAENPAGGNPESNAFPGTPIRESVIRMAPPAVLALASLWVALLSAGLPYPVFWWMALLGAAKWGGGN